MAEAKELTEYAFRAARCWALSSSNCMSFELEGGRIASDGALLPGVQLL